MYLEMVSRISYSITLVPAARFNSTLALAFLISSLEAQTMSLYSYKATHPCFHPLYASFLCD